MRFFTTTAPLLARPVSAQNAPTITRPNRDIVVTYRTIEPSGLPAEMRMAWSVAAGTLRVDLPGSRE